jgi:hypothetical protein
LGARALSFRQGASRRSLRDVESAKASRPEDATDVEEVLMNAPVNHTVDTIAFMISEFERTHDPARIAELADHFADSYDPRAIPALLARVGDPVVQANRDVEDAVCGALVIFGVMRVDPGRCFFLQSDDLLKPDVRRYLRDLRERIPARYVDNGHDRCAT